MNTYRLRVRPIRHLAPGSWHISTLNSERLVEQLPGAGLRAITNHDPYHWLVDLQLSRDTHEQALNEIFVAIQRLGFEVVNVWITEWAGRTVEGALLGFAGGGTAGSASGDAELAAVVALAGSVVGGLVGSQLRRVEKVYELTPSFGGGWGLTPVPLEEPGPPLLRPRYSPG